MSDDSRIELTVRLWGTGATARFEDYVEALTGLLPRHRGTVARRIDTVDGGPADADTILVLAFPDATAIDGFLRDPARADFEELAGQAVSRSLITDGRTRTEPEHPATLHELRPDS
ncbi:MAG: hypothetical protein AAGE98_14110 [Actinomycetota bacterium]